ncbi:MAG: anthranilate synthase component I family protein [Pseudomonadota bacterium]
MNFRQLPWRSPFAAFAPLEGRADAHLLHGRDRSAVGRADWSIIVVDPADSFELRAGDDPAHWLETVAAAHGRRRRDGPAPDALAAAPFLSGLVGYLGYEALAGLEPSLDLPVSPYALPAARLCAYDAAALFNTSDERLFVVERRAGAGDRLAALLGEAAPALVAPDAFRLSSNFSRDDYIDAVSTIIERIGAGDFFQANIAQMLLARSAEPVSMLGVFMRLATQSDAAFGALLQFADGAILSNSPERFFRIDVHRRIVTEPIKGTRPRGQTPHEDIALAEELLADAKDRAENIMIADLMRNDLSKICRDHTIREDAICALLSLSHVHHLVSRISGGLRDEASIGDVFKALFPSGSITGAPKIAAMQAIADIERVGRGPYCGAIGYIDDRGAADFSVAIRTMIADAERRRIAIPVGGGVTLRSNPPAEYDETIVKAAAALAALGVSRDVLA